jgi:NitT/TauT family transport system permease protein
VADRGSGGASDDPARSGLAFTAPALAEAEAELAADLAAISPPGPPRGVRRRWRPILGPIAILLGILVAWQAGKWLGGDIWRVESIFGVPVSIQHVPPFKWALFTDLRLPHLWVIGEAFFSVDAVGTPAWLTLLGAGAFTFAGAFVGFVLGAGVGLGLAIVLIRVRLLERSLVPLLVASQTVPIVAVAPVIVVGLKAGWFGIALVAGYLTFFPVTIAAIRGMRSADPRAFELMRSYAATERDVLLRLRLPAATPFLFTAFKVAATASVVGAIVGELPSGIRAGLAGQLLGAMQYYSINPGALWAAIVACAILGILCFAAVVAAERRLLRDHRPSEI